jgi:tetratricopeptide (TPR) repeat protein
MKTIFVLLLIVSAALFGALYVIDPAWTLLVRVPGLMQDKQFHEAKQQCERVLNLKPSLFAQTANDKVGAVHLAAAQAEIEKHNFSAAQDWLTGLLNRTGAPTGSEAKAGHLLKELPGLHYQQAHALLLQKEYEPALAEYQEIERLYKDDPVLDRARPEACIAEVEAAKKLDDGGDPEAALDRLSRLPQSWRLPPWMVTKALYAVPDLSERAIRGCVNRGDFEAAFALMQNLAERFPDPEITPRLKDVIARFDLELFQVALEAPERQRKAAGSPAAAAAVAEDEKVVLHVKNETQFPLRLVYVGPQRVEISLPAQATREVTLAPGRYLAGVYWPDRKFRPSRQQVTFQAGQSVEKLFRLAPQKEVV